MVDLAQDAEIDGVPCTRVRLTCGHWSHWFHARSSTWDFPDDALWCDDCAAERQMDLAVQAAIYESWSDER